MWDIALKIIIVFLGIYFVMDFIGKVIQFKKENDRLNTVVVIKVKNRAEHIEGIIRTIIWKCLKLSNGGYIPYIMVVDMGSDDETLKIAENLRREYEFIIPLTYDEYQEIRREENAEI